MFSWEKRVFRIVNIRELKVNLLIIKKLTGKTLKRTTKVTKENDLVYFKLHAL
ncbi:hypothetical protein HMPREF0204_10193 [Chryseobacterium gleum ATCC 35910]|uniref:Uncharacterized protein n=1 Tax=Chryseobacterium gleum ATCC 35910 TaxID=525257 RepID=A0ABP2J112_CHRGE|nr:hypothetical protein HMPREF0204_10193 [Chryseobacterium gleum ATCC 35910]